MLFNALMTSQVRCTARHKIYFIELVLNIKYIEFWKQNLYQKPVIMSDNLTGHVVRILMKNFYKN